VMVAAWVEDGRGGWRVVGGKVGVIIDDWGIVDECIVASELGDARELGCKT